MTNMLNLVFVLLILTSAVTKQDRVDFLIKNDDIRNTWQTEYLEMCTESHRFQPPVESNLSCERVFNRRLFDFINVEVLSRKPALVRIRKFGDIRMVQRIYEAFQNSSEIENQRVEGMQYSAGYRGRVADGLWLEHHESSVAPLFKRLQDMLTINPAIAENFLILKYNVYGHYAPHYDHLFPMHRAYDYGWFEFFGNRMATALFILETATKGGATIFPLLKLTIQPERGDLILWINADSNDNREEKSLHAACPIEEGHKIAVSLWFRSNFQDRLKSSVDDSRYDANVLVERKHVHALRYKSRPPIQFDYEDNEDELWLVEEEDS